MFLFIVQKTAVRDNNSLAVQFEFAAKRSLLLFNEVFTTSFTLVHTLDTRGYILHNDDDDECLTSPKICSFSNSIGSSSSRDVHELRQSLPLCA